MNLTEKQLESLIGHYENEIRSSIANMGEKEGIMKIKNLFLMMQHLNMKLL